MTSGVSWDVHGFVGCRLGALAGWRWRGVVVETNAGCNCRGRDECSTRLNCLPSNCSVTPLALVTRSLGLSVAHKSCPVPSCTCMQRSETIKERQYLAVPRSDLQLPCAARAAVPCRACGAVQPILLILLIPGFWSTV